MGNIHFFLKQLVWQIARLQASQTFVLNFRIGLLRPVQAKNQKK